MADRLRLPVVARSLVWSGDELIDYVGGSVRYRLDGSSVVPYLAHHDCDAVVSTPDGHWAVVFPRTGTQGTVLERGRVVRSIARSSYQAAAYEYPACLWRSAGRVLLAHCPDEYNRIEIDDAETGERLTRAHAELRSPSDRFHSRLQPNPAGTRLLSAGWIWHPVDAVGWFDIAEALTDSRSLDQPRTAPHSRHLGLAEEGSACWQTDDRILLGGSGEPEDPETAAEADAETPGRRLPPNGIAIYAIHRETYEHTIDLGHPPGTMMAIGDDHVVTFYGHPRLVDLRSGKVVREWPDLDSGRQTSSIVWKARFPPLALDPVHRRFALADAISVHVITLTDADLR
jgi:hypothetical protein